MRVVSAGPVPLDCLLPPVNPRRLSVAEDDISAMAESLAVVGQLQAIVVRAVGDQYEIVVGHCRSLAARRLGWVSLRADVVEASDDEVFWARAHENGKRIPLAPRERVKEAVEAVAACDGDIDTAAFRLGYSRATVEGWVEVAGWPEDVREAVFAQEISRAAAAWLARVSADQERRFMLRQAVENGYGERITRHWYQDWTLTGLARPEGASPPGPGSPVVAMPDPLRPCDFCAEHLSYASLRQLFVCGGCRELILLNRPAPVAGGGGGGSL